MADEVHIVLADPAGNITLLVTDKIEQCDRVTIANRLLGIPDWKAEQVGFIVPSKMGGDGRLEMMGGEFCGNALRSFGYYMAVQKGLKQGVISAEISGAGEPLIVEADTERHIAWTQMPVPQRMDAVQIPGAGTYPFVVMDGIWHVILEHAVPSETLTECILNGIYAGENPEAVGIMYVQERQMTPVVYVAATDTLVHENSCGSGSIAYAYYLARNDITGTYHEKIRQPGGTIETALVKESGEVKRCSMGGRIGLSKPVTVRL